MIVLAVSLAAAFALALALTPAVKWLALRVGAVDQAVLSTRKIHQGTIPRLGGLSIVVAFYTLVGALLLVQSRGDLEVTSGPLERHLVAFLLGGLAIAALGIYDDLRGARASHKFVFQIAVAIALYAVGLRVEIIYLPFAQSLDLGLLAGPFTVLWIVGVINAINLIDGLDGLASGVGAIAALATLVLAWMSGNLLVALVAAIVAGAALGFLVFNFHPASIFLGDTGSLFLGYVLAVATVQATASGAAPTAAVMLSAILILGLPIVDTGLAIARRLLRGRPLFVGDRDHIHHRALARWNSQRTAALVLYAVCAGFGAAAIALCCFDGQFAALVFIGALASITLFVLSLGYLSKADRTAARAERRVNREARQVPQPAVVGSIGTDALDHAIVGLKPLSSRVAGQELRLLTQSHDAVALFNSSRPFGAVSNNQDAERANSFHQRRRVG